MKILVDADACPVKEIIEQAAKEYNLDVVMVSNPSHKINSSYDKTSIIVVDGESQASDIYIANHCSHGDIAVTQDYGLACIVLAKGAKAIHPNGKIYNNENIDGLLMQRYTNWKIRKSGHRIINPKKRSRKNDIHFSTSLRCLIEGKD